MTGLLSRMGCVEKLTLVRIAAYTGPVKEELLRDEITFAPSRGAPPARAVPRAVLSPGPEPEGHRRDPRRLAGHGVAPAQARGGRGPGPGRARPAPYPGAGD